MYDYDFREEQLKYRLETLEKKYSILEKEDLVDRVRKIEEEYSSIGEASFENSVTSSPYFTAEINIKLPSQTQGNDNFVTKDVEGSVFTFQEDGVYLCLTDLMFTTTETIGVNATVTSYKETGGVKTAIKARTHKVPVNTTVDYIPTSQWVVLEASKLDKFSTTISADVSCQIKYGKSLSTLTIIKIK